MDFAVVIYNSFEPDNISVRLFGNRDEARQFLLETWQNRYNAELAEAQEDEVQMNLLATYHEEDFAQIEWKDGAYSQFILTEVGK